MEKFVSNAFEAEIYDRQTGVMDIVEEKVMDDSAREVRSCCTQLSHMIYVIKLGFLGIVTIYADLLSRFMVSLTVHAVHAHVSVCIPSLKS